MINDPYINCSALSARLETSPHGLYLIYIIAATRARAAGVRECGSAGHISGSIYIYRLALAFAYRYSAAENLAERTALQ
jgi:hypothetical protein